MFSSEELLSALHTCSTPFHYVKYAKNQLAEAGYTELSEKDDWTEIPEKFYVSREDSALVAIDKRDLSSGVIISAHCDTPRFVLKRKTNVGLSIFEGVQCAPYGGGLWHSNIDREYRLAGKVIVNEEGKHVTKFVSINKVVCALPSGEKALTGDKIFQPITNLMFKGKKDIVQSPSIIKHISSKLEVDANDIVEFDLSLVPIQKPGLCGINQEYLCSPRIDDQSSAIVGLWSFLKAKKPAKGLTALAIMNFEEVGSFNRQGARSNFLESVFNRLGCNSQFLSRCICISADVVHGFHPNYQEKYDPYNKVVLGTGPSYSINPDGFFSTDSTIIAVVNKVAKDNNIPVNVYSDINKNCGGATFGSTLSARYGFHTMDLGIPVLGMHSQREMAAVADFEYFGKLLTALIEQFPDMDAF